MEITPFALKLFEATPSNSALIKVNPPNYTIVAVTEGFILGARIPRDKIIGKSLFTVFPSNPDELEENSGSAALLASFKTVIQEKTTQTINAQRYDVPNDQSIFEERYWRAISTPLFDDNGEVNYIIHTPEEITDSVKAKRLEEERSRLTNVNAYLQRVINMFNTPLQVLQPIMQDGNVVDFRYNMTNSAYASYANTTSEAIQGKKVGDVFPGYFQTSSFINVVRAFETGVPETWDIHYNLDGLNIYNTLIATKMDDEVVVHIAEFTKLKNLQLELERRLIELERSNRHLEAFAYAASHDLKEPIRKIHIFSGLLKESLKDKLSEVDKKHFERLDLASRRMYGLVEDLLTYSEVSQLPKEKQPVDLNLILEHTLGNLDWEIEQKKATINTSQLFTANGYEHQLKQVFQNLISNALKYSKPDVPPVIDISCAQLKGSESGLPLTAEEQSKDYCRITIKDNGIGFEQVDAEVIFNMFTRLHGSSKAKGTGIGLSIVRKVIENHQGFIWAQSAAGEGASFKILLPYD